MKAVEFTTPLRAGVPTKLGLFSDIHCLDTNTEILTTDGFKGYSEISGQDKLINYNTKKGELEIQKINKIISYEVCGQEMYSFESKYVSFCVSDKHRMYVSQHNQKESNYDFVLAKDLNMFRYDVMSASTLYNVRIDEKTLNLYKLCIATACDGHWGNKNRKHQYVSFHINKSRKTNKIKQLLSELQIPYTECYYDKSVVGKQNITIRLSVKDSQKIFDIIGIDKNIPMEWLLLSVPDKIELLNTWAIFDGTTHKTRIELVNTNEHNIDVLQAMAVTAGISANKLLTRLGDENHKACFRVSTNSFATHSILKNKIIKSKYSGIMWCVNSDNGTIIIRRNGKVMIIGNCDSPDCDKATFKEHLDYCLKDHRYILINGDLFDAILLKDQKRAVPSNIEHGDNQLNVKLEETAHFLTPYKDNILLIGRGNHCEQVMKYNGLDMLQMLTSLLNAGNKHQILYGNYANFVRFNWLNAQKKSKLHYDIYMHHGMGSSSASVTKGIIDFNRIAKGVNVDLIWTGHRHNAIIDASDPIMFIDQNGKVVLKNRQCIQTPSYQKGRTIDYNVNFAERFYSHTALSGFGELTLTPQSDKDKYYLNADLRITTKPQAILGEVVSSKLTQRKR